MKILITLLVCSTLCGCMSSQSGMHHPETYWKIGQTSPRDVVTKWGNPDSIENNIWIWKEHISIGGKAKAAYMGIGFLVYNHRFFTREHRLDFSNNGKLKSMSIFNSVPGGANWSLNPWCD